MTDHRSTGGGVAHHAEQDVPDPSAAPDLDRIAVPRRDELSLSLAQPIRIHVEMARAGLLPWQLRPSWSADTERIVDPLDDPETRRALRRFLKALWDACVREGTANA